MIKVICLNEPDISYTRNKALKVGQKYSAELIETKLDSYGICLTYKIYDNNGSLLGTYYARDFKTIQENRESLLEEILN